MNAARRFPLRWTAAWLLMFGAFVSLAQDQKRYDPSALPDNAALWNLPDGATLRLGKGTAGVLEYSPDGKTLAVGGGAGVWLYDAETGAKINLLRGHAGVVLCIDYAPDGKILASGNADGEMNLWDGGTGEHIKTLTGHTDEVKALSFSRDGKTLASASLDGTVLLWDLSTLRSSASSP